MNLTKSAEFFFKYIGCQVSNETDPKKINRNHSAIFKRLHYGFCLIFWGQSHLKPDIQRSALSTEPFLRDICGLRYLKKNSALLVRFITLCVNYRDHDKNKNKSY